VFGILLSDLSNGLYNEAQLLRVWSVPCPVAVMVIFCGLFEPVSELLGVEAHRPVITENWKECSGLARPTVLLQVLV